MKSIKLESKEIKLPRQEGGVITKNISTRELLESAIAGYQEGAKGIDNIIRLSYIYNKIRESKGDKLEIEDADFDMLYDAVDKAQWVPMVVTQFPEFFEEIKNAKNGKGNAIQ